MGLKRAFEASVAVGGKAIKTRGDITYEETRTEIEVKNAASEDIRFIAGMKATNFQMTVQAGTDPEDESSVDGYAVLLAHWEAGTAFSLTFTSPGGLQRTKDFIITAWSDANPVDGLNEATVTFKRSAVGAEESSD